MRARFNLFGKIMILVAVCALSMWAGQMYSQNIIRISRSSPARELDIQPVSTPAPDASSRLDMAPPKRPAVGRA